MGVITLGFDSSSGAFVKSQFDKDLNINDDEKHIANHFMSVIFDKHPSATLSIEQRSNNYISLCSGRYDFLRFKYTDRARWLSIDAIPAQISEDDPRFSAQTNKRARHWKAKIKDLSELSSFDDLVIAAYANYDHL